MIYYAHNNICFNIYDFNIQCKKLSHLSLPLKYYNIFYILCKYLLATLQHKFKGGCLSHITRMGEKLFQLNFCLQIVNMPKSVDTKKSTTEFSSYNIRSCIVNDITFERKFAIPGRLPTFLTVSAYPGRDYVSKNFCKTWRNKTLVYIKIFRNGVPHGEIKEDTKDPNIKSYRFFISLESILEINKAAPALLKAFEVSFNNLAKSAKNKIIDLKVNIGPNEILSIIGKSHETKEFRYYNVLQNDQGSYSLAFFIPEVVGRFQEIEDELLDFEKKTSSKEESIFKF